MLCFAALVIRWPLLHGIAFLVDRVIFRCVLIKFDVFLKKKNC